VAEVLQLVALSGSLRAGSYNTALLRALPELAPPTLHFTLHTIAGIPVYNGDDEDATGLPPAVVALRAAIRRSDGLVIATPEYNNGIPGPLKNALDWCSRPPAPHGLDGIPTAILGASDGAFGTARSQHALRQTLVALNAPTFTIPQMLVAQAQHKIDATGKLTDEATRGFLTLWLLEVERWMRRFPKSERAT
jgi:chromate reductase, NAD(P)H dehydrogenase (quinone)